MAQVEGGFGPSGPYYQSNNCLIQGIFISELLDLRLRTVTFELLTGLILRSLVAPSKEGPADIYIYVCYIYVVNICIYIYSESIYLLCGASVRYCVRYRMSARPPASADFRD